MRLKCNCIKYRHIKKELPGEQPPGESSCALSGESDIQVAP